MELCSTYGDFSKPSITSNDDLVTVAICKPGISAQDFVSRVIHNNVYLISDEVETSCDFRFEGEIYFFTATRLNNLFHEYFIPVFTHVSPDSDTRDGKVGISYEKTDDALSQRLFESNAFREALAKSHLRALPNGDFSTYLEEIRNHLFGTLDAVSGYRTYDIQTGVYEYAQHSVVSNPLLRTAANLFGAKTAINLALEISRHDVPETTEAK